jgi:mono/diheme cytochrome c family protein
MRKAVYTIAAWAVTAPAWAQQPAAGAEHHLQLVETYCGDCHNATDWAGGVAFDTYNAEDIPHDINVWESVVVKMRGHLMPPPGSKQPSQAEIDALVGWLETSLDSRAETPRAGHVTAQRMNRTEYANAVRSLLGVDIKVEDLLPPESELHGFDNIASVLSVSPSFLDQYISAARYVARRAVGDPKPSVAKTLYQQSEGGQMPLGSAGGIKFRHFFPADGEYRLSIVNEITGTAYTHASLFRRTVVILIDGKEVFRADVGGPTDLGVIDREAVAGADKVMARFRNIPLQVTSGTHEVIVTSVERARVLSDENIGGGGGPRGGGGGLGQVNVEIAGPYGETRLTHSPSRDRIFVCYPQQPAEERACAGKIARELATRAYRRPVTDADVSKLMAFYDAGRREIGHFDGGVQEIVMGTISSPDFLYRVIAPRGEGQSPYRLNDLELASRLSFFLWGDVPDDALLKVASEGRLSEDAEYARQVERMLRDRRAASLVTGFAMRWLNVDDLQAVKPDPEIFRGRFSEALRDDFSNEIRLFLSDVLLQNRSIIDLLNADYTFLNERLANHYGIKGVLGSQFRRVQLTDPVRHGLLGKGAVLLRTSYADRTSPVLRGAWVLERLIGTPPTPPPPGVETNLAATEGAQPTTLRARLEVHRSVQSCNQCHGVIDPLGLALENFDVTGAWRTREIESRLPVDASTVLPDGTKINGVVELREALLRRPEQFAWSMTQKLMMYALGREVEAHDMPQVRRIVRNAAADNYRFFDLVKGVVESDAFRMQGIVLSEEAGATKATVAGVRPVN